jgi:predicted transcriptional regulator
MNSKIELLAARRGEGLRALRQRFNLRQVDVADALKTKPSSVSDMEAGRRSVTLRTIDQLADMLGVSSADVLIVIDNIVVTKVSVEA